MPWLTPSVAAKTGPPSFSPGQNTVQSAFDLERYQADRARGFPNYCPWNQAVLRALAPIIDSAHP
ncbi:MAG: hypothetical protein AB1331_06725 [Bacillota bacterium]